MAVEDVRMKRSLQMYQWMEEETAGTVYRHGDAVSMIRVCLSLLHRLEGPDCW